MLKCNVLCISAERFKTFNDIYKRYFPKNHLPEFLLRPGVDRSVRYRDRLRGRHEELQIHRQKTAASPSSAPTSSRSCCTCTRLSPSASARLISERTIAALAAAKSRGQALGNPKLAKARAIANANHLAGANTFADSVAPAIREAQAVGAKTLRQIAAALSGRGIGTARGGKWEATTVANVLRRRQEAPSNPRY